MSKQIGSSVFGIKFEKTKTLSKIGNKYKYLRLNNYRKAKMMTRDLRG